MLRVSLLGNMGADPETRYTQKGAPLVSFNVAVNQVRTGPGGERQENTEWFRVRVTNQRLHEYVSHQRKGTRVLVIGRLDIGHYQGKDGDSRTSFDVWADDVVALSMRGPVSETDADSGEGEQAQPVGAGVSSLVGSGIASARASANANGNGSSEDLEELPF